jgi:hypothetical protein
VRLIALCLAALVLAGCGGGDEEAGAPAPQEAEVRAAVQRLYAAAASQDGAAMCRTLTPAWRRRLTGGAGSCPAEALQVVLGPGPPRNARVRGVAVTGGSAVARAEAVRGHGAAERTDRVRLELRRLEGRWLVAGTETH